MAETATTNTESADPLVRALDKLGEGSTFLTLIFVFTITPTLFNGMHSMSYIFIAEVPDHWCTIPELEAANWSEEQIKTISSATPCSKYNYDYKEFARIGYEKALEYKRANKVGTTECTKRSFTKATTGASFVEDWDLVCERTADRSSTHMALSLGKMIGSVVFGAISDKYGRKLSYAIGIVLLIISGPASAVIPWYWGFMIFRFISGLSHAGIQYSSFTTLAEVAGERHRKWMGVAYNCGYASGIALTSLVAYMYHDWRDIQMASSLPAVLLVIHMWYMPESPRWLISQNRREAARVILEKALKSGPIVDTGPVAAEPASVSRSDTKEQLRKNIQGFQLLVSNTELFKRVVITCFAWMTASLSYYALALNIGNFTANRYIFVLVMGITEIPAYLIPAPILMMCGRRPATGSMYTGAALCLLFILMIPKAADGLILMIALIGRFTLSAVYGIVILYSSELFPTVSRNSAVGTNSAMSHVGSVAAPYVADLLGAVVWWAPTTLCGTLALISGLLCSFLPETRGRPLADSIEEEVGGGRELVSIKNIVKCRS